MNLKYAICILFLCFAFSSAGPVSWYGMLATSGNRIKSQDGSVNVLLKGPSLYWSSNASVASRFYNEETVNWFVETMDISVIRAAMGIKYWDGACSNLISKDGNADFGYLSNETSKEKQEAIIDSVVRAAILNDIYVIIDWHTHCGSSEVTEAGNFFEKMAKKYKDYPNVIFEIYNEPPYGTQWSSVQSYAVSVIKKIRDTSSKHLILVGSPENSSRPNQCANAINSLGTAPIACTLHFYAATHPANSNNENSFPQYPSAVNALSAGVPVFASEWGSVSSNGAGQPDRNSAGNWMTWMNTNMVSNCYWNASNLDETSSIWDATKYAQNGMSLAALSSSGKILHKYMGGDTTANNFTLGKTSPRAGYPYGRSITSVLEKGKSKTWTLADLGAIDGEAFDAVESPATIDGGTIKYTASTEGSKSFNYTLSKGTNKSKHRITVKAYSAADEINVSYKADTELNPAKLGIVWWSNKTLNFTAQSVSPGAVTRASNNRSLTYKPVSNASKGSEANLSYTIGEGSYTLSKSITLNLTNMPPDGGSPKTLSLANTSSLSLSLDGTTNNTKLNGSDPEGDPITIDRYAQMQNDPGTVSISTNRRTLTYKPAAGKKSGGRPIIYYWLTDGEGVGEPGKITLNITGSSTDTNIGDINDTPIRVPQIAGANFGIVMFGKSLSVELAKSAVTQLDVYSLTGAKIATLMRGRQNAGSYEFNLSYLSKGVYIVRLRQGSEFKTLKIVR